MHDPSYPSIRQATLDDVPFIMALGREKYAGRGDTVAKLHIAEGWVRWCIGNTERLVLVGPNSAGIASVSWNYGFERVGRLDAMAARQTPGAILEAIRLVRLMLRWSQEKGAIRFRLTADTGADFAPFAKRLGGRAVTVTHYEFDLERPDE